MSSGTQGPESASRKAVGEHFRRLRRSLSWTLQDVAERVTSLGIPVSHSTLSRVESGRTTISADLLMALGETLGASFEEVEEIMRLARSRVQIDLSGSDLSVLEERGSDCARMGDFLGALGHYRAARDLLLLDDGIEDRGSKLAEVMLYESECHRRLRQYSLSLRLAGQVLNQPGISAEFLFRALVLHVQAGFQTGDFYQARLFGQQVRSKLGRMPLRWRALGLGVLAALEYKQERWKKAITIFRQALGLYETLGFEIEVARMGIGLGYSCYRSGAKEEGEAAVLQALASARRGGYRDVEIYALLSLGRIATENRDRNSARKQLDSAAALAVDLELPHEEFIAIYEYWTCCKLLGDRVEGARRARRLSRLLKRIDHRLPEAQSFLHQIASSPRQEGAS